MSVITLISTSVKTCLLYYRLKP